MRGIRGIIYRKELIRWVHRASCGLPSVLSCTDLPFGIGNNRQHCEARDQNSSLQTIHRIFLVQIPPSSISPVTTQLQLFNNKIEYSSYNQTNFVGKKSRLRKFVRKFTIESSKRLHSWEGNIIVFHSLRRGQDR